MSSTLTREKRQRRDRPDSLSRYCNEPRRRIGGIDMCCNGRDSWGARRMVARARCSSHTFRATRFLTQTPWVYGGRTDSGSVSRQFNGQGHLCRRTWRQALLPSVANVGDAEPLAAGFYYIGPASDPCCPRLHSVGGRVLADCLSRRKAAGRSKRFWLDLLSLGGNGRRIPSRTISPAAGNLTGSSSRCGGFKWGV